MSSPVDQIKERLSIVDVVSSYVKLERAGGNYKARCPFHSEKTPSFFVSPARESFHCFGCNKGGDIFTFVSEFEGLDFKGALKVLADRAGVKLFAEDPKLKNEKDALYAALEKATAFWESNLRKNPEAIAYLKKRGLNEETIKDFRLGFAEDSFTSLASFLRKSGVAEDIAEKAGLSVSSPKGRYDRFRSRIMFPIFDSAGRVVAFSGRIFDKEDDKTGKYVNSPETALYSKSKILYGFDRAKQEIRKNNACVLVEGQMDLIMSHQSGTKNAVAISGTALTEHHLEMISRLASNLIVALDADPAGMAAARRSVEMALGSGLEVKIVDIPEGLDPADLILKDKPGWERTITEAKHAVTFYLEKIISSADEGRKIKVEISRQVLPLIGKLGNKLEQAHFVSEVARKIKVSEEHVWEEVVKAAASPGYSPPEDSSAAEEKMKTAESSSRKEMLAKKLVSIILWQEGLKEKAVDTEKCRKDLTDIDEKGEMEKMEKGLTGDDKRELIFECESYYEGNENTRKEFDDLLLELKKEFLKEDFGKTMEELRAAELSEDHEKANEILKKCQDISRKINSLK